MAKIDERTAPAETDAAAARILFEALKSGAARRNLSLAIQGREVPIPASMVPALIEAAKLVSEGHAIECGANGRRESAPRKPADLLKVSRPYLLNLVKKGIVPCRMVGAHTPHSDGRRDRVQARPGAASKVARRADR